jgi:hypothetical protein
MELLFHIWKYGSIEWHYFSYGFDIKGLRTQSDYLDDSDFLWKTSMLNTVLPERDNTCILRDKHLFSLVLSAWGYQSPKVVGVIGKEGDYSLLEEVWAKKGDYFFKPIDGQCGGGVFELSVSKDGYCLNNGEIVNKEDVRELTEKSGGGYIIQTKVLQHDSLNSLYDQSINTIRLVTVFSKRNNQVVPLSAVLRVGAHGNVVDNWAAGGLAICINLEDGCLQGDGFYKHGKGTKTKSHPDTGVVFSGFAIPFFHEAVTEALELHRHLLPLMVIGWDIAITPDGPLFIEGNDNMEISINQEVNGGLRAPFESLISSFHQF